MSADGRFSSDGDPLLGERRKEFWANAIFGAIATFAIGVIPLVEIVAPVVGGALAGYVQNTGTTDGAKIGVLTGAIGGIGLNLLTPPRLFGLPGGDVGDGFYLIAIFLGFAVWVVTGALGGALGARLAENRHGSPHTRR